MRIRKAIRSVVRNCGYDIVKYYKDRKPEFPVDFESRHINIIERVAPYTLTGYERIYSLIESVRHVVRDNIEGVLLECGVYKGGSMMAVALTLISEDVTNKDLYLFDTFEGMPAPGERDIDIWGTPAADYFSKCKISDASSRLANASLDDVKQTMASTGYPMERIHFVKGLVENTIPEKAPESIALLRLDTDWYQSTIHELTHLYPRLSTKGIAIIDDYGHYKGAREAVDEYFNKNKKAPFLHRIDYTGRLIIKI